MVGQAKPMKSHEKSVVGFIKAVTVICWALTSAISGEFPMDTSIPPLRIEILLAANSPKSRILVRRLAVVSYYTNENTTL